MPELPDVQIFKEYFDATSLKRKINGVDIVDTRLLENISGRELRNRLSEKTFTGSRRYGKYLFACMEQEEFLVLHFGMTGFLRAYRNEEKAPEHIGLLLHFTDGYYLAYDNRRRLGHISMTKTVEDFVAEKELGPDALELCGDKDAFAERLGGHRGSVKSLLMNQKVLAGIGNIYSDEILFLMGLHPEQQAEKMDVGMRRTLAGKTCHVLNTAIDRRTGVKGWPQKWLLPRRKEGKSCPRCSGKIKRITVSGRGTYYCNRHQK